MNLAGPADRRADVDAKQAYVSHLLQEIGVDGLLILQPENFAWMTAGGSSRSTLETDALPGLYITAEGRWLLSSNDETQRLFDEEIDGLGFQLKEWPWHWGRANFWPISAKDGRSLATHGSAIASTWDHGWRCRGGPFPNTSAPATAALGQIISHALEATGRTFRQDDSEREVAGQIGHRLLHRGATPLSISVAGDGRSRTYRVASFSAMPIHSHVVLKATAQVWLMRHGQPDDLLWQSRWLVSQGARCVLQVSATYVASSWPDAVPRQILAGGFRIYQLVGAESEWFLAPQGHLTGRAAVEMPLTPNHEELLEANWAITWQASIGAAPSCDTFLIGDEGARAVTATESWPLKRIRTQGAEFVRPDLLVR